MTEQMSSEVDVKNGQKSGKVHFLKCIFLVQMHLATHFFLAHVKFKSKITYLSTGISRIHRQMTEQWSFEVTVKNVTEQDGGGAAGRNFYFICLGYIYCI